MMAVRTKNDDQAIDTATQTIIANTLVDQRPRDAEFSLDDSELWVSSEIGGTVSIIDTETKVIKQVINFEIPGISKDRIQPVGMELTSDGKTAFIALGPSNHIAAIDRSTMTVTDYILVGRRVWHMALTPEEDKLYTTNGVSGDVTLVDVQDKKALKTIKVGRYPWGIAILPKDKIPN